MNRLKMRMISLVVTLIVAAIVWTFFKSPEEQPSGPGGPNDRANDAYSHLRWGNPSGAREDPSDQDDFLMKKEFFALSYNNAKGTPNWVSWRLAGEDLGHATRNQMFRADDDLPAGFKKVVPSDYTESGFDRGHMCPYGDRESTEESRLATFIMTNAVPQSPADNRRGWERFESYCRLLVSAQGKELYIISGPYGEGGVGEKGPIQVLHGHDGPIVVPARTWKVVLVLDRSGAMDENTRLIAVDMPNDQTVDEDWAKYLTTTKKIEADTHYTFFDKADASIIGPLKEKVDAGAQHGR